MRKQVRLILLDLDQNPKEQIEGYTTSGSISISGKSTVTRTCNLTMVAVDPKFTEQNWCFNSLIRIQVRENTEWYEMGVYVIISFSSSQSENSYTINIQGQDKMCRLNGTINGALPAQHDFGTIEEELKDGTIRLVKLPIKTIVRSAVKQYALEKDENIIINDLPDIGYELWEYDAEEPFYYFRTKEGQIKYVTWDGNVVLHYGENKTILLSELLEEQLYSLHTMDEDYNADKPWYRLSNKETATEFQIIKISKNSVAGYHPIELVYSTDLILNAGDTVTAMLEKLCTMLGDFEFFYTVNGKFVFQKKKNYVSQLFSTSTGALEAPIMQNKMYSYRFDDDTKFISKSFNPTIKDVKNDFVVLGQKKLATGVTTVIHARYAIDEKPLWYQPIRSSNTETKNSIFKDQEDKLPCYVSSTAIKGQFPEENNIIKCDWREVIYQMARDFYQLQEQDDFQRVLEENNPWAVNGITKYEQYYSELFAFWRDLYFIPQDKNQLEGFYDGNSKYAYWNDDINTDPGNITFWIDFLEPRGELADYSVKKIGSRIKVDTSKINYVTSLFNPETPEVLLKTPEDKDIVKSAVSARTPLNIDKVSAENAFFRSSQGLCAIEVINDLLVNGTQAAETISLSCLPICSLDVNTRIYIKDKGDYTIDSISLDLSHSGKMNLSATKILKEWL